MTAPDRELIELHGGAADGRRVIVSNDWQFLLLPAVGPNGQYLRLEYRRDDQPGIFRFHDTQLLAVLGYNSPLA